MGFERVDPEIDNMSRYQNGTTNLLLISGNVYSIYMTDIDVKYLYMASDISINESSYYWVLKVWIWKFDNFCLGSRS
jgi:hypothetical protein